MLTVPQALALIESHTQALAARHCPLHAAGQRILASDIVAPADSPPFDKALMDGFAVLLADVATGTAELEVLEVITAGHLPQHTLRPGTTSQVMTGAPLPGGTAAVIQSEHTTRLSSTRVRIASQPPQLGQNLMRQGGSVRAGAVVLPAGTALGPVQLGALAEMGCSQVPVTPRVRAAVLATGDELVAFDVAPQPGQIRNSNETLLAAQLQAWGCEVRLLGIARDDQHSLQQKIRDGLTGDLLLLTGGVSAGILDLVPQALAHCGVRQVFHKIEMKPGKPLWFGQTDGTAPCAVFGLPGNPVSSLVCTELFVRTAVRRLLGERPAVPASQPARLATAFRMNGPRPVYHPAHLSVNEHGEWQAALIRWHGSSDLCGAAAANGMVYFPAGEALYDVGTSCPAWLWAGQTLSRS